MKIQEVTDRPSLLIDQLLLLWEASVRETHLFLSDKEIKEIKTYVPEALKAVTPLLVAYEEDGQPMAFMGLEGKKLEMLFVDPQKRGCGVGKALVSYGREHYATEEVVVNEQNPLALGFYEHMGFCVYERKELDEQGNPYPILLMRWNGQKSSEGALDS